jgi:hypothetical protein
VEVALVRSWNTPVLTRGFFSSKRGANWAIFGGNLGRLGRSIRVLGGPGLCDLGLDSLRASQVLGDELLIRDVIVNCDAGQKADRVLLKSGGKDNAEGIHLKVRVLEDSELWLFLKSLWIRVTYGVLIHIFWCEWVFKKTHKSKTSNILSNSNENTWGTYIFITGLGGMVTRTVRGLG